MGAGMRLQLHESTDGDRAWVSVNGAAVAYIRVTTLARLVAEFERPFGPQELVPVVRPKPLRAESVNSSTIPGGVRTSEPPHTEAA